MPKFVYCSVCGTKTEVTRKALKNYGRIVELIDPHKCLDEPIEFDLSPNEVPSYTTESEKKFVKKLNGLSNPEGKALPTEGIRDRRFEDVKLTAPQNLIENLKGLGNVEPENSPLDGYDGEEDEESLRGE